MDKQPQPHKQGRDLKEEEKQELRVGQELYEMTQTAGWKIVMGWLKDRAFHSWVDPKTTDVEKEWVWRELNLFHSADVAKQLMSDIERAIGRADHLSKVMSGEAEDATPFKI